MAKQREPRTRIRIRIRKDDLVQVIAGRDRGKRGKVLQVMPEKGRLLVQGVNFIKRHTKPNPQRQIQGGVVEREAPIALCKLMLIDPDGGKPTRVGWKRNDDGTVVRIAKRSGAEIA
jgi:large subunit ribosomal protein L24